MHRRLLLIALALVVALGISSSVALAGGGNSANAKACQKNGWENLQTSSGSTFASQSECASYGASGGTLFGPRLTATDGGCFESQTEGNVNLWTLSGTGFSPDSSVTINGLPLPFPRWGFDSAGSIIIGWFTDDPGVATSLTFTDGNGVYASVTFTQIVTCN